MFFGALKNSNKLYTTANNSSGRTELRAKYFLTPCATKAV
jgi:hypothetical protein